MHVFSLFRRQITKHYLMAFLNIPYTRYMYIHVGACDTCVRDVCVCVFVIYVCVMYVSVIRVCVCVCL